MRILVDFLEKITWWDEGLGGYTICLDVKGLDSSKLEERENLCKCEVGKEREHEKYI